MGFFVPEVTGSRAVGNEKSRGEVFFAARRRNVPSPPPERPGAQCFCVVASATCTSGVRYYGYRYYSPELGRWPSRDPIGELGATHFMMSDSSHLAHLRVWFMTTPSHALTAWLEKSDPQLAYMISIFRDVSGGSIEIEEVVARVLRSVAIDPTGASSYPDLTEYVFVENTPLMTIDPDGLHAINSLPRDVVREFWDRLTDEARRRFGEFGLGLTELRDGRKACDDLSCGRYQPDEFNALCLSCSVWVCALQSSHHPAAYRRCIMIRGGALCAAGIPPFAPPSEWPDNIRDRWGRGR